MRSYWKNEDNYSVYGCALAKGQAAVYTQRLSSFVNVLKNYDP